MATVVGTSLINSISNRYVFPEIVDAIYPTNALFFRLNAANKKLLDGGTHVELPWMYQQFANGGPYQGYDVLDVSPNDTVKNGAWDIRQHYVPVTISGLDLAHANSPQAIVSILTLLWEQAAMQLANNLGTGLYSDMSDTLQIDGLKGTVDAGSVSTTYGGLTRSSNTWLNSTVDSSTATLTEASVRTLIGNCTFGGHRPTLLLSRIEQYNRMLALVASRQQFNTAITGGYDDQLASIGFTNILFDLIPWVVDSKVFNGPSASNSAILALNEEVFKLLIFGNVDFFKDDFQKPVNQDAMTGMLKWYGNLMCLNPQLNGKMTNVSA